VVSCSVVNLFIEVFLSGLSFEQSFYSRLVAIPVNILIAWPYGMYRDLFLLSSLPILPSFFLPPLSSLLSSFPFPSPFSFSL
ncbi:L-alanine exporter AlaE, partial [Escherichia coli]|uniref:L-alanine exporter AlaE n=1 Tax=Escherichia coli TaxID=562 RepID=UPI000AE2130E